MDGQEEDMRRATMNTGIGLQRNGDTIQLVMPLGRDLLQRLGRA